MYQKIKTYLEISKRELRGMMVFIVLLIIIYLSPYVYEKLTFEPVKITIETLKPRIEEIESYHEKNENQRDESVESSSSAALFNFDPNHLPLADWVRLGLSEKQARAIKNYEAKGGRFRNKADVKKMYSISPQQFSRLEPYIQIPGKEGEREDFRNAATKPGESKLMFNKVMVDINSADSALLTSVRGIGPGFAARIVKYRDRLGGFYSLGQLREVYGLDSAKYDQIKDQIKLESVTLRLIDINQCSFEDLKSFPYLSYKQMNTIIAYRSQHGAFNNVEDLHKIGSLNPSLIQKMIPYLKF